MRRYEIMVILNPALDERSVAPSLENFLGVVRNDGGSVEKVDIWGKRRLAYEIMKQPEGTYFFYRFRAAATLIDELGRQMRIDESILRHMIVRDELAEGSEPALEPASVEAVMGHPEREAPREESEHRGERY